jgi:hypothetical protein
MCSIISKNITTDIVWFQDFVVIGSLNGCAVPIQENYLKGDGINEPAIV